MAITKVTFGGTSVAARVAEISEFLQTYASDYFDTITYDDTDGITCTIDDVSALKISTAGIRTVTLASGASYADYNGCGMTNSPYGYVTDNGVWIAGYYSNACDRTLFVTKSNTGKTAILWAYSSGSYGDYGAPRAFIPETSQNQTFYNATYNETFTAVRSQMVATSGITVFAPVGFPNGDYCPNLFLTPLSQYTGYQGVITDGSGNNYVYDGMFALKD